MTLILVLVLILVLLIIIDFYYKNIRFRQKKIMTGTQKNNSQHIEKLKTISEDYYIKDIQHPYPLLKKGFLLFYFEGIEKINIKDLEIFLKYYGFKYTDEKAFQIMNNNNVIFSILPKNEEQVLNDTKEKQIDVIIAVMNYRKLADMKYDVEACYEFIMNILDDLRKSFRGTLMNEHKIRLTNKDKKKYLENIL